MRPVVLTALKVLSKDSKDVLMDTLAEFRVSHRSLLAASFSQPVAQCLDAFRQ